LAALFTNYIICTNVRIFKHNFFFGEEQNSVKQNGKSFEIFKVTFFWWKGEFLCDKTKTYDTRKELNESKSLGIATNVVGMHERKQVIGQIVLC
jgi:hypothetical protein